MSTLILNHPQGPKESTLSLGQSWLLESSSSQWTKIWFQKEKNFFDVGHFQAFIEFVTILFLFYILVHLGDNVES